MPLKSLPIRAPLSKVAPRRRTPVERPFAAVEAAAAIRALTRLTGKGKRRKLPSRAALAALGGGLAAVTAGVVLARKRSSGGYEPPASMVPGSVNGDSPEDAVSSVDHVAAPVVAPGADPEAAKIDVDAPNEGATGDHPTSGTP